eukprot:TRINITY_DN3032_c0_g1_i1.p1 TRINITY_DN3032_c0_g1~~TRINITY_DN3032_c0_g1_i1.p1  ORF type:complete len:204 (+),score=29.87 TRINITY_DN3032_c0_g1_i1:96-707(+)
MTAGGVAEVENGKKGTVCVTGANGYIASWLIKLLLQRGYFVVGTVRNPEDQKNAHLKSLEGAEERLRLVKADLMDYESLVNAINGCQGVFHLASPVTDDPEEMVEPAVKGTRNVLDACAAAGVRRVVFTSSIGAVHMDPNRDPDKVVDETCWSDLEYCKATKVFFNLFKFLDKSCKTFCNVCTTHNWVTKSIPTSYEHPFSKS